MLEDTNSLDAAQLCFMLVVLFSSIVIDSLVEGGAGRFVGRRSYMSVFCGFKFKFDCGTPWRSNLLSSW